MTDPAVIAKQLADLTLERPVGAHVVAEPEPVAPEAHRWRLRSLLDEATLFRALGVKSAGLEATP